MVAIKTILFTLASVIAVNADWQVSFTYADGGQVENHGFVNSDCVNFSQDQLRHRHTLLRTTINADTLELYGGADCRDLAYTAGPGSSNVPDKKYLSYKVY
jgi:hypothetical protein